MTKPTLAFSRRLVMALAGSTLLLAPLIISGQAQAQQGETDGLVLPMTGPFASTGRQIEAAAKLYVAQHGPVAGKTIELVIKDDTGAPDITRRIAQELLVNDKVSFLAGFGLTPLAFAAAPLATQAKTPLVVMAAATSSITEQSPFVVRTSFTLPQVTIGIADWAAKNGVKKAMTLVSEYGRQWTMTPWSWIWDMGEVWISPGEVQGGRLEDDGQPPGVRYPRWTPGSPSSWALP